MIYKGPDLSFSSFHIAITFPMNDFPPPQSFNFSNFVKETKEDWQLGTG